MTPPRDAHPDHEWAAGVLWERCARCRCQFAYPHLCRQHALCGMCHPQDGQAPHE